MTTTLETPDFTLPDKLTHADSVIEWQQRQRVYNRPITFDEWLNLCGKTDFYELIDGVLVEQEMVQLEHESAEWWIKFVVGGYADANGLGKMLGSRSPVKIHEFRGRLPDLFFVRQERMEIVQQKATYGAPDLVIEVLSPGDRRAGIVALETDYRLIRIPEIMFVDLKRLNVRVLRLGESGYAETIYPIGSKITFAALDGLTLKTEWLVQEPRPAIYPMLTRLLSGDNPAEEEN